MITTYFNPYFIIRDGLVVSCQFSFSWYWFRRVETKVGKSEMDTTGVFFRQSEFVEFSKKHTPSNLSKNVFLSFHCQFP